MKIREVVERILAYHPATPGYRGCDDYKCGDPEAECTGVVTALSPNISVIRKAIELNANLIVVHEPTFYTSEDGPGWFEPFGNSVYQEKRKLLDDHGIVVWRDHGHAIPQCRDHPAVSFFPDRRNYRKVQTSPVRLQMYRR